MSDQAPPQGFEPHFRKSPFTDPWEPLYSRADADQIRIGTWIRDVHCNSRGLVHGGFISSLADNSMGLTCGVCLQNESREFGSLVTVSLNLDFTGLAKVGQWIETDCNVVKLTRSLGFIGCLVSADGSVVARATANFKIG